MSKFKSGSISSDSFSIKSSSRIPRPFSAKAFYQIESYILLLGLD